MLKESKIKKNLKAALALARDCHSRVRVSESVGRTRFAFRSNSALSGMEVSVDFIRYSDSAHYPVVSVLVAGIQVFRSQSRFSAEAQMVREYEVAFRNLQTDGPAFADHVSRAWMEFCHSDSGYS